MFHRLTYPIGYRLSHLSRIRITCDFWVAGKSIPFNSTFNPKTGVKAKDDKDGDLTNVIRVEGKVDTKKVGTLTGTVNTKKKGTYTLTYTVTDKSKNQAEVKRKITVK